MGGVQAGPRASGRLASIGYLLHGGAVGPDDLRELESKLYFDAEGTRDPYVRFAVLLVLSVVIATGGVLADSTATVIGAMIVAPLMTPIMASALAIVTGDIDHLWRSLLLVGLGVVTAIGLAFAMAWLSIGTPDPDSNSQIVARTSPRTIDLIVALASGAAGAFALSRRSVADALPGVAIAISLVPPLGVVGISLAVGDLEAASGAFLLFATNFLAILVAGGLLLALMGYGAMAWRGVHRAARRRAAVVTAVTLALALIPLTATTIRVAQDTLLEQYAGTTVKTWLEGSTYELLLVTADGDELIVTIEGAGPVPAADALTSQLRARYPGVEAVLRVLAGQRIVLSGG